VAVWTFDHATACPSPHLLTGVLECTSPVRMAMEHPRPGPDTESARSHNTRKTGEQMPCQQQTCVEKIAR
jgi:hypothetical protein